MTRTPDILILAGTPEARDLAQRLRSNRPAPLMMLSFAGRVDQLPETPCPTRIGGFGGADGLKRYLQDNQIRLVVDATHAFARQMTQNAHVACAALGIPLLRLLRPQWSPIEGDRWQSFATTQAALETLKPGSRPFLALGRQELAPHLSAIAPMHVIFRSIEKPDYTLPIHWTFIQSRPGNEAEETDLLRRTGATHLVTKNSGGSGASAKLAAARSLGLPVFMIERPVEPDSPLFDTAEAASKAICALNL